jgi:hypothetical protein
MNIVLLLTTASMRVGFANGCLSSSAEILLSLNTKPMLAQHIPHLSYTSLTSPWELPEGFTEPLFADDAA